MKNKNKYENNLEKVFIILSYVIFFLGIALSIYSLISGIFEKPDDLLFGPIPKIMKFFASFVYLFYAFAIIVILRIIYLIINFIRNKAIKNNKINNNNTN